VMNHLLLLDSLQARVATSERRRSGIRISFELLTPASSRTQRPRNASWTARPRVIA
jgi:hypothetical protein